MVATATTIIVAYVVSDWLVLDNSEKKKTRDKRQSKSETVIVIF